MNIWEHPKVNRTSTCWEWMGARCPKGYGWIRHPFSRRAHRVSYLQKYGVFPKEKHVLHKCDNPSCIRPSHLFLGDDTINQRDSVAKGRHWLVKKKACPQGHPYSGKNLYLTAKGWRMCRECMRIRQRRYHAEGRY